jgi:hypothetical protein
MLSKCANPSCPASFRYLHEGRLFRIARSAHGHNGNGHADPGGPKAPQQLEYFWLCDSCASQMTMARTQKGEVRVVPRFALRAAS